MFLHTHPLPPLTPKLHTVFQELNKLGQLNNELLLVANKAKNTIPILCNDLGNTVIDRIETDLRAGLNSVVSNIMEFWKDSDARIRNLGNVLNTLIQSQNKNKTFVLNELEETEKSIEETFHEKYTFLSSKIETLENSLRETKNNERGLMKYIENFIQRRESYEQPTLIKENWGISYGHRKQAKIIKKEDKNASQCSMVEKGFKNERSKSAAPCTCERESRKKKSFYGNLQELNCSQEEKLKSPECFRLIQKQSNQEEGQYIKNLYSKKNLSKASPIGCFTNFHKMEQSRSMNKMERSEVEDELKNSKAHRLSYMIENLNV